MRLILVRHAKAEPGKPDELRPLTPEGREDARALGERLRSARPDAVISSPLRRARETAAPIAAAAGVELRTDEHLTPGATLDDVRTAVAGHGETVVVVGHVPDLEVVVLELTGRQVRFTAGGVHEVDL